MPKNHTQPNRRHVVPAAGGGWNVLKPHAHRPSAHASTKQEAINTARRMLRNDGGGELTIHNLDGQISDSDTVAPGRESPTKDRR